MNYYERYKEAFRKRLRADHGIMNEEFQKAFAEYEETWDSLRGILSPSDMAIAEREVLAEELCRDNHVA